MASELGVQGLAVPVGYGGAGAGYQHLAHVFEECGRALFAGPLLATLGLALPVLLASGDEAAQTRYLPGIADGATVATRAGLVPGGGWDSWGANVKARPAGEAWQLTGAASVVPDALSANLILVTAGTATASRVFAVDPNIGGVTRSAQPTLDQTRPLGMVRVPDPPPGPARGPGGGGRPAGTA